MSLKKISSAVILIISLFCISNLHADGISISQLISHDEIAYEDSATFEILLSWEGSPATYLFNKPLNPYIDRLKVRGFTSSISSKMVENKEITTKKFIYTLIPTSAGLGLIDSISISYINRIDSIPGELMTEPMNITIALPVAKDDPQAGSNLLLYLIIAGLVIIGIGLLAYLKLKKSQPKGKKLSPTEKLLNELTNIKQSAGSNLKLFQTGVYKILSEYLLAAYNLNPANLNEEKLVEQLKATNMTDHEINKISAWLIQAEKDKYSPLSSAPGDTIRLESEIRQLFDKK